MQHLRVNMPIKQYMNPENRADRLSQNIGKTTTRYVITQKSAVLSCFMVEVWHHIYVQQNSNNPAPMGSERCPIIRLSGLWDCISPTFLQAIFCYCSDTRAIQPIWGTIDLNNFFIWWFRIIMVVFRIFWSLRSWLNWWIRRQGIRKYYNGWYTSTLEGLTEHVPGICLFHPLSFFFPPGNKQNFRTWDFSPQVPAC